MQAVVEGFFPDLAKILSNYFPSAWSLLSTDCTTPYILLLDEIRITHPFLGISALGGILIGIFFSLKIFQSLDRSNRVPKTLYSLSFLFFSMMNTGGILFHCLHPPPVYVELLPGGHVSNPQLTYFGHVIDVCSTCCACLAFLFGRLHAIGVLQSTNLSFYYFLFLMIYVIGFIGIVPTPNSTFGSFIPFLPELLYPGVLSTVVFLLPFCSWPIQTYFNLFITFVVCLLAFGTASFEGLLCDSLGSMYTAAGWCFFFSDIIFILLYPLTGVTTETIQRKKGN